MMYFPSRWLGPFFTVAITFPLSSLDSPSVSQPYPFRRGERCTPGCSLYPRLAISLPAIGLGTKGLRYFSHPSVLLLLPGGDNVDSAKDHASAYESRKTTKLICSWFEQMFIDAGDDIDCLINVPIPKSEPDRL
jgi:hypothetical protein